jgi:predicted SAM-dependent methyltransferase
MVALEGWLNTDVIPRRPGVIPLDAAKPFPFRDSTFNQVFSEHQIDQLSFENGRYMLKESYRVLKPGGTIRIACLSLDTLIALCDRENTEIQDQYIKWITDQYLPDADMYQGAIVTNHAFYAWGHKFLYDSATLEDSLNEAGFVNVSRHSPGESGVPELQDLESHGATVGNEKMGRFETMVLEGAKA